MTYTGDFWSARRAKVAEEEANIAKAAEAEAEAKQRQVQEEKSDSELLAEHNLPDPDALTAEDDFSGFMAKTVPERLRQRALRKLWRLNPVLANVDGLVDYGEDFTDAAMVIENLASTYQVGKGMLAHLKYEEEKEQRRLEEALAENDDEAPANAEDAEDAQQSASLSDEEPSAPVNEICEETGKQAYAAVSENREAHEIDIDVAPLKPRRMQFRFVETHAVEGRNAQFERGVV